MKKLILVLGMLVASSVAFAQNGQDSVRLEIGVKVNQVYRLTTTGTYKGDVANTVMNLKISGVSASGEKLDYATGDVPSIAYSPSEIRIVNNNSLEIKDLRKGTTQVVSASVEDGSIVVSSEQIGQSVAAELKKQGQDLINTMSLSTADATLNYNLNISNMNCAKAARDLTCDLSAVLVLNVSSK